MDRLTVLKIHEAYVKADQKELERLWCDESPRTLIKFYPGKYEADGTNYFLDNLRSSKIWLSSPLFFNDPFDCAVNYDFETEAFRQSQCMLNLLVGESEVRKILDSEIAKTTLSNVEKTMKKHMSMPLKNFEDSMRVACFSEPDNLTSLIMWSHYADSHSGVCVEYDFETVKNVVPTACIPVKYTDVYRYSINPKNNEEGVANFFKMYTKSTEWEYEKEWRISVQLENSLERGCVMPIATPKRIYLGCRIKNRLKEDVTSFCRDNKIELYQMKIIPGSFCLDYERV